ncbi:MAG: hydrogenase nickel incorporation protein HypB [Candidatus Hydrogenedentes bacterium]|nr:hydrogenase nickel incorporation protein HypB [Candidatus Hydrogenedentota bacterium]
MEIPVVQKVLKLNDDIALLLRERFEQAGVVVFNFISAPGSGKTSLLETTIRHFRGRFAIAVIEGDPDSTLDAQRIARHGCPVVQIQTSGGCHLEANLVQRAIAQFDLDSLDALFIENVGNMVCPVEFDLGEHHRVVLVSTPEGSDKPAKYPKLFRTAGIILLNKCDLLPYVPFDRAQFDTYVQSVNPEHPAVSITATRPETCTAWFAWAEAKITGRMAVPAR